MGCVSSLENIDRNVMEGIPETESTGCEVMKETGKEMFVVGEKMLAMWPRDRNYWPCVIKSVHYDMITVLYDGFENTYDLDRKFVIPIHIPEKKSWIWYWSEDGWYQGFVLSSNKTTSKIQTEDASEVEVDNSDLLPISRFIIGDSALAYFHEKWMPCFVKSVLHGSYIVSLENGETVQLKENLVMDRSFDDGDYVTCLYHNERCYGVVLDKFLSCDYSIQFFHLNLGDVRIVTNDIAMELFQPFSVAEDVVACRSIKNLEFIKPESSNSWDSAKILQIDLVDNKFRYHIRFEKDDSIYTTGICLIRQASQHTNSNYFSISI